MNNNKLKLIFLHISLMDTDVSLNAIISYQKAYLGAQLTLGLSDSRTLGLSINSKYIFNNRKNIKLTLYSTSTIFSALVFT